MKVVQAYRFALGPSPAQERMLRSHAGASRFAWNWGLAKCIERYEAEKRWYSAAELHRLGAISTHESTRKLGRRLENGSARILSATVSRIAQRWFVSFTAEVERAIPARHSRPGSAIGIDLGVKTLLTGVDDAGNAIAVQGPKALRSSLRKLKRASREHSRKQPGSANRRKAAARVARIHARVASVRADALHKATTGLAARYHTVIVEDLNVTGMLANRHLARAVADQGFGAACRQLAYKTAWNGGQLLVADRWFPSSKRCSRCGWRKPSLTLAERTFKCGTCGLVTDRDVNAARNLLGLAASGAERKNACGAEVRPGRAGRPAMNQEPGTAHAGKTGTVPRQHGTAA